MGTSDVSFYSAALVAACVSFPGGAHAAIPQVLVGGGVTVSIVEGRIRAGAQIGADARYLFAQGQTASYQGESVGAPTVGGSVRVGWRLGAGPRISASGTAGMAWSAFLGRDAAGFRPDNETDLTAGAEWAGGLRFAPLIGLAALHQTLTRVGCYGTDVGASLIIDARLRVVPEAPELSVGVSAAKLLIPTFPDTTYYWQNAYCMSV